MLNTEKLTQLLQLPLPGASSQLKMAPENRAVQLAQINDKLHLAKKSAVMILLFLDQGRLKVALIRRSEYDGFHSGQMAFPGGKFEETDGDFLTTALRETHEEIGIPSNQIEVLGQLTELFIPPSNFLIKPFVGFCHDRPSYFLNKAEVQEVVEIDITELSNPDNLARKNFYAGALGHAVSAPYYKINQTEIWGATAMIISELVDCFSVDRFY